MMATIHGLILLVIGLGVLGWLVYLHIKLSKIPRLLPEKKRTDRLQLVGALIVAVLSWILNIGWLRLLLVFPIILHLLLFTFAQRYYARYGVQRTRLTELVRYANLGTFLLSYILMPDGGDTVESMHAVFGLIHRHDVIDYLFIIAQGLLILNIVLIVAQIVLAWRGKRTNRPSNESSAG